MDNKIATYMEEEDMELTVEDTYASVDVEMLGTDESEGRHMPSFPSMNMININETAEQPFEHLRTFMDIDPADTNDKGIQAESRFLVKCAS